MSTPKQQRRHQDEEPDRLSLGAKWLYGLGEMGPGLAENAISFFLLFYYVKIVRLDPGLAGIALMIGRFWDAVTDPAMGYISDHTKTRWGRRRPYLIFGAVPYGLFFFLLWAPFLGISGNAAFPLLVFGYLAYSTAATVCQVPFYTLGGELSTDYHERSSIISVRQIYAAVGILIGAAGTPWLVHRFSDVPYGEMESRPAWLIMAVVFGAVGVVTWFVSGLGSRERVYRAAAPEFHSLLQVPAGALRAALGTLRNPHFRTMAGVFLIVQVAFTMTTSTLPFLLADWLLLPHAMEPIMATLIVTMLPFLNIWVRLSRRLGKRVAYILGLSVMGILALNSLWIFVRDLWQPWIFIYPMIFAIGLASHYVFPWALMPDIIDYDELETGRRQDGPYFGVMTFLRKSSAALSSALVGFLLNLIGYDAALTEQSDGTLLGIRLIYGLIPGLAFLGGMLLFTRYPLTQAEASQIRARLQQRRAAAEGAAL